MRYLTLISGKKIPVLGQGTSQMNRTARARKGEIAALRRGIELGMNLIDTAELYGTEELVGEAIEGIRDQVYLVSKVLPYHASKKDVFKACERSLKKLKTDYLDLYLLHWPGSTPLTETIEAFQDLKDKGWIIDFGISNLDVAEAEEAKAIDNSVAVNQVLYNLLYRGIEWDLLPWAKKHKMPIMAYSPFDRDGFHEHLVLNTIAKKHRASIYQIALAWVLRMDNVMAIPKASSIEHVEENFQALSIKLDTKDLQELDASFPPPKKKIPLETI